MPREDGTPPIWLMGLGFIPYGVFGALALLTVPQLLSADHVPEDRIALVTSIGLFPGFGGFLISPLLDWRFSRKTYAIGLSLAVGICLAGALLCIHNLTALTVLLFGGGLSTMLCVSAVGGWFGGLVRKEDEGALGAWFTVANLVTGGLVGALGINLLRAIPYPLGAVLLGVIAAGALPLFVVVRCPPADDRLAHESFRAFAKDVGTLLARPEVLWTLPLFLAPSASFALTNMMGGLGPDYHTSERLVSLIGGGGVIIAGVVGSLSALVLSRRVAPRPLYLGVGVAGALFTASQALAPRDTVTFSIAVLGENIFQAASFAVQNFIVLRTIGQNNPLAATQFGVLAAATALPLSYMQFVDGQGYAAGGVAGGYFADAAISGGACVLLALMLYLARRRIPAI